eukprot:14635366-Ditylum_brightwellii.AAC.1
MALSEDYIPLGKLSTSNENSALGDPKNRLSGCLLKDEKTKNEFCIKTSSKEKMSYWIVIAT